MCLQTRHSSTLVGHAISVSENARALCEKVFFAHLMHSFASGVTGAEVVLVVAPANRIECLRERNQVMNCPRQYHYIRQATSLPEACLRPV